MSAALFLFGPCIWRSTQLTEALSVPPRNHRACGGFHSSTVCHGDIHSSVAALDAQYVSGSRAAASETPASLTCACARKFAGGGKERVSVRSTSMSDMGWREETRYGVYRAGEPLTSTPSACEAPVDAGM